MLVCLRRNRMEVVYEQRTTYADSLARKLVQQCAQHRKIIRSELLDAQQCLTRVHEKTQFLHIEEDQFTQTLPTEMLDRQ